MTPKNWNLDDLPERYKAQLQGDNPNPEYPEPPKPKRKNAQPERDLRRAVMEYAQRHHWRVIHVPTVQIVSGVFFTAYEGDGKGWPDLLMLRGGSTGVVCELKAGDNTTTRDQNDWLEAFMDAGFDTHIWTLDDWQSGEIERILS